MKCRGDIFAYVALLMFLTSCGGAPTGEKGREARAAGDGMAVVQAHVEVIRKTPVDAVYEAVGTVRSKTVANIQSKGVGHVTAVHVKEGDLVEVGTPLVEIDDRDVAAQLQKAESGVQEAERALQEATQGISAAESAKAAADAQSELADATFQRYKGLAEKQAVSQQVLDEAAAKQKAASAEASQAQEMVKSMQAKRGEVEARIEQAKAEVANAQVILSFTKLTSPMHGIVTMKNVDVGDLAAPNAPLLAIEDNLQYRLEAMVDEAHVGQLHVGDQGNVVIDALAGKTLTGTVAEIVPAGDPASRTFVVKLDVPATESLRSGMFGRAQFKGDQEQVLAVPKAAIVDRGQLTGVYAVDEQKIARLRLIKTGKSYGDRIEVLSGLSEGETIVIDRIDQVTDGARVEHP